MERRDKILYIQEVSSINKWFDLPYYIFKNVESNGYSQTISPMRIGLKVTNNCAFNCEYCFTYKDQQFMSLNTISKIIHDLDQKPYEVYLTGGDPLLHPNICEIIEMFNEWNIQLKLQSTGIAPKKIIDFLNNNPEKFSSIQISIDSINQFEKIRKSNIIDPLNKIKDFINSSSFKNKINVNTVISKYNYLDLKEIIDFCYEQEIQKIRFSPIFCKQSDLYQLDNELIDIFYDAVRYLDKKGIKLIDTPFSHPWSLRLLDNIDSNRLFCPACKTEIEVDCNGNVYPCPFLHDNYHNMGNIYQKNINEIWLNGAYQQLSKSQWSNNKVCVQCKNYTKCGGGCYANAFINRTDYDMRCIIHEKD